ncbi:MAG: hypothetical protein FJ247_13800 [Nitrospira sp.]|nr:hypothetical protein [Nitrospira sp.]
MAHRATKNQRVVLPHPDLLEIIRRDIDNYEKRIALQPDRHQRIAALTFLIKHLDALDHWVRDQMHAKSAKAVLSNEFLPQLGRLLSAQAMEQLLGPVAWGISERAIESILGQPYRSKVTQVDRVTESARQSVAVEAGPILFAKVISTLRGPLERALRMEKGHRGGRPPDIKRNHVVDFLARDWEGKCGSLPPGSKTGPFVGLCNEVLIALKLSTDGLEDCMQRTLRRLRSTRTRAP